MKETISVNLASQAFTFDKDAYRRLKEYLDAIRRRLPAGDPEILNDVEARLAEIFRSRISSPMMVVTLQMVQGAMAQMGDPSEFGELPTGEKRTRRPWMRRVPVRQFPALVPFADESFDRRRVRRNR